MRMNVYVRWTVWGFNRSNRKLDNRETETEIERQTNGKESETDWQIEIAESWEKEWEREREGSRERSRTRFHRNCSFVVDRHRRTNRSIHRLLIIPKTRDGGRNLILFSFFTPTQSLEIRNFRNPYFFPLFSFQEDFNGKNRKEFRSLEFFELKALDGESRNSRNSRNSKLLKPKIHIFHSFLF